MQLPPVILFFLFFAGCSDFVEVDLPSSQLTSTAVFQDKATATAAMTDIYARVRDAGLLTGKSTGLSGQLGLYSDELAFYGSATNLSTQFYRNALLPAGKETSDLWNAAYGQIYAANAMILGLDRSATIPEADKSQLKGEAIFIRALLHFYLLELYGSIPYATATDYETNRRLPKLPAAEVYALIIADLEQATALLPEDYVSESRARVNSLAAKALLARVYLYAGLWAEASNAASAVLNSQQYHLEENIDNVFLNDGPETIWQLMAATPGGNTSEAGTFIFTVGPPPLSALSLELLGAFGAGDLRKAHWTKEVTAATGSWSHAYKYKKTGNTGSSVEYSIVLRLAEQYLIRAEARAMQGELIGAKEDLNAVRHRAGLGDTDAITAGEIAAAVLSERRLELFTEFGHRFFDLKRLGKLDTALGYKPGWNSTDRNFPLPESELLLNPNLAPQNEGY